MRIATHVVRLCLGLLWVIATHAIVHAEPAEPNPPLFVDVSYRAGVSRTCEIDPYGPLWADLNGDGYLDLALHTARRQYLLENRRRGGHWLLIRLEGTTSNRFGIGARVRVFDGPGRGICRENVGDQGSDLSRGCAPSHVGLGPARVVGVMVAWPGGEIQVPEKVAADQVLRIVEP